MDTKKLFYLINLVALMLNFILLMEDGFHRAWIVCVVFLLNLYTVSDRFYLRRNKETLLVVITATVFITMASNVLESLELDVYVYPIIAGYSLAYKEVRRSVRALYQDFFIRRKS